MTTETTETAATEAEDRIEGRVLEATGTTPEGGRVYRVRIISSGDSKNGRRYPAAVLRESVSLYEGAKAYDHHRSGDELRSSTISGLVGYYRNVEATDEGLDGDLVLLPGAKHTAEALDATVAGQAEGRPPLVGISHDALTYTRPIQVGRRRLQEAVSIAKVHSADVVADPAAGGKATRVLAGGIETDPETSSGQSNQEEDVTVTSETVLAALQTATPEQLLAVGLSKVTTPVEPVETAVMPPAEPVTEAVATEVVRTVDLQPKGSFLGKMLIRSKIEDAGLPVAVIESVAAALPDRITEADVDAQIAGIQAGMGIIERAGLEPRVTASVAKESLDSKKEGLDKFFNGDFSGYRSFKQAFVDITGRSPRSFDEDFNKTIMRECVAEYDSENRTTESLSASSWSLVLGDSITRRLVAEYNQPNLMTWRNIVSSVVPINDFRTQRIDRIGGYGTLPPVNQGAPYQPLTSPTNEEVTYAITKRGGTEDITLEMIANDDVRAISRIPKKLGLAAAQTLYRFVWDFLNTNSNVYDTVALFSSGSHLNDGGSGRVLTQGGLSAARAAMRQQSAYGDSKDILSIVPSVLVVPSALEEIAYQLTHSAVAIPGTVNTSNTAAAASNTPNIHQGLQPIVVDYFNATSAVAWYLVADPSMCPTIELGFYQGQETPQMFTQSDPTVGSVFNADTVTYKIRHIYSGAVLDYRGFQRAGV